MSQDDGTDFCSGIEEAEWMPPCNATYKCGITFDGWSTKPGFESYFHPFASMLDNLTMTQFVHNANARINYAEVHAHPDRFFIAARLATNCQAPKPLEHFPFDVWHGYHFDAALLGEFLHKKALERGVRYKVCHVTHATLDETGAIAAVETREGETIGADLFVDCAGLLESPVQARHLKMRIGRVTQHWNKNCLAVGLAQGFIEALEATALLFIQQTADNFVKFIEQGDLSGARLLCRRSPPRPLA